MKPYSKIKKRKNRGYFFVPDPMVTSFKKPKIPLSLIVVRHPLKKTNSEKFVIEEIIQS